jgi:hypothetical protein
VVVSSGPATTEIGVAARAILPGFGYAVGRINVPREPVYLLNNFALSVEGRYAPCFVALI